MKDHPIPPMTHELGRHWNQPPLERVLVDDTHAVMTQADFNSLPEYSSTMPGGVYPGKMWRRHDGIFDAKRGAPAVWLLCWYGELPDPSQCSINFREALFA